MEPLRPKDFDRLQLIATNNLLRELRATLKDLMFSVATSDWKWELTPVYKAAQAALDKTAGK